MGEPAAELQNGRGRNADIDRADSVDDVNYQAHDPYQITDREVLSNKVESTGRNGGVGVAENATTVESEFMDDESVSFSVRDEADAEYIEAYESGDEVRAREIIHKVAVDDLTPSERYWFDRKLGEILEGKTPQFIRSRFGEYIFVIDRKLVYNNGDAENPVINHVLTIDLDDETDIDTVRHFIYDAEEGRYSHEQARRIFEGMYGEGIVRGYDSLIHRANARKNRRRKGSYGRAFSEGSGAEVSRSGAEVSLESVDLQARDPYQITDREILANAMDSVAKNKDE